MQKIIHFSVDDVLPSLKYFSENQNNISSIWELDFYKILRGFHEKYGLTVTLNVFDFAREFSICNVPQTAKRNFMEAREWLQFSYHGRDSKKDFYLSDNMQEFIESYENAEHFCMDMQERKLSGTIRLHFFEADKKRIAFLKEKGVTTLLTADDDRLSYSLSPEICKNIEKNHSIVLDGINYVHSDYRVENIKNIENELEEMKRKNNIVLFTHEWCFVREAAVMEFLLKELLTKDVYKTCSHI